MRKILSIIIILTLITSLLLFSGCKSQLPEEGILAEQEGSLESGVKAEEEDIKKAEEEKEAVEDEENDGQKPDAEEADNDQGNNEKPAEEMEEESTESQINTDNEKDTSIEYANNFTLLDLDGNEVSLSDFQGKIIILNFWATWCPPCRSEIPDFIEVNNLYQEKNVRMIGVSVDEDIEALKEFVEDYGINYLTLIDGTVDYVSPIWDIRAVPTTYILNKNGEVIFKNVGMMTKDQLAGILDEILREEVNQ